MHGIWWLLAFIITGIVWPFARPLWWLAGLFGLGFFWQRTKRAPRLWIVALALLALWPLSIDRPITGPLMVKEVRDYGVYAVEKGLRPRAIYVKGNQEGWAIGDVLSLERPLESNKMSLGRYRLLKSGEPVVATIKAKDVRWQQGTAPWWVRMRQRLDDRIEARFPPESVDTVRAMVTGTGTKGERYVLLQHFGLAHVLAISGLHVALLYGLLRQLLDRSPLGYTTKLAISLAGLWVYALIVGMGPSIARAALMLTVVVLTEFAPWPGMKVEGLALAACLLLLYRPLWLFHPGFILSFACMWALLVIYPALDEGEVVYQKSDSWRRTLWMLGALFLVTWPLQMRFFGYVSLWSGLANLVMLPVYTVGLVASWVAVILPLSWGRWLAEIITYALVGADAVMNGLYGLWKGQLFGRAWGTGEILLYELLVYLAVVKRQCIVYRPALVKLAAAALAIPVLVQWWVPLPKELQIHYLDVGQGDAILLQRERHGLLIDTGGARWEDVGQMITVPELRRCGVEALDGILVSHWDLDHCGALSAVARQFPPGGYYASYLDPEAMEEVGVEASEESLASWKLLRRGDELYWRDMRLEVLWPPAKGSWESNEASMVLRLHTPYRQYVFTGDLELEAERQLTRLGDIGAQVLKVGHHGSRFSSSRPFLAAVNPTVAVISCGRHNAYGHPHQETLERLADIGAVVYRTDEWGTISLVDGELLTRKEPSKAAGYGILAYLAETGFLLAWTREMRKEGEDGLYRL